MLSTKMQNEIILHDVYVYSLTDGDSMELPTVWTLGNYITPEDLDNMMVRLAYHLKAISLDSYPFPSFKVVMCLTPKIRLEAIDKRMYLFSEARLLGKQELVPELAVFFTESIKNIKWSTT